MESSGRLNLELDSVHTSPAFCQSAEHLDVPECNVHKNRNPPMMLANDN